MTAAAIEAALPHMRAEAEALMVDTFEVGDPGDWVYDEDTGEDVRAFTVDFTCIGRLVTSTAPSETEAGERTTVSIDRTLHIPWVDGQAVASGKHARRVFDGAEFQVLADVSHSHPKSRRLAVEEILDVTGIEEIFDLADDLRSSAREIASALYDMYQDEGETFADDWRDNARQTSGQHGRFYPNSITSESRLSLLGMIVVETGPEYARRQGPMGEGFEFGSINQPPHLDGLRALPQAEARLLRAADATIGFLLP